MTLAELAAVAEQWRPETETTTELLDAGPARALAALLNQPSDVFVDGTPLPPTWTALHFLEQPAQSELGVDGHPSQGRFLPPLPRRRRLFAGGRAQIVAPLLLGEQVTRQAEVVAVTPKSGRTGDLLFVTVRQTHSVGGDVRIIEEHDLVYRSASAKDEPRPAPLTADHEVPPRAPLPTVDDLRSLTVLPDPVMLFRFSALTYNAHRIHYDRPYAVDVEGLPGLLVHGPLLVVLALELPRRYEPDRTIRTLSYRLRRPVTVGRHVLASIRAGDSAATPRLEVRTDGEGPAMTAEIEYGSDA